MPFLPTPRRVLAPYFDLSERIPGWTRGAEAEALAQVCLDAPDGAEIVEIGSFFGCATVLMAGARKLHGSGRVHAVDPFDGSGDQVSTPHYDAILLALAGRTQREHLEHNLRYADVEAFTAIHAGTAAEVAASWATPIDLLFLDGDQSPTGAREAYGAWIPFLKPGGIIALHNSADRDYQDDHDGHRRLVVEEIETPAFEDVRMVGSTTFARRVGG